jgi:hypothetical protein
MVLAAEPRLATVARDADCTLDFMPKLGHGACRLRHDKPFAEGFSGAFDGASSDGGNMKKRFRRHIFPSGQITKHIDVSGTWGG